MYHIAKNKLRLAVAGAKELYSTMMETVCGGDKPYLNTASLEGEHVRIKDKALDHFNGRRKMGGAEFSEKYKERLDQVLPPELDSLFIALNSIVPLGNRRTIRALPHSKRKQKHIQNFQDAGNFMRRRNFLLLCFWIPRLAGAISPSEYSESHHGPDFGYSFCLGLHQVRWLFLFFFS